MRTKFSIIAARAFLCTALFVTPALSHHSHAMFDHTKDVMVTGTVTQWVLRNPHAFLYIDIKNEKSEVVNYSIEMSNIPNMITRGINQSTFHVGDKVSGDMVVRNNRTYVENVKLAADSSMDHGKHDTTGKNPR